MLGLENSFNSEQKTKSFILQIEIKGIDWESLKEVAIWVKAFPSKTNW